MSISLYKLKNRRKNELLNKGYDYRDKILIRNTNPEIYKNFRIRQFGLFLEKIIQNWFDSVKKIKLFVNYNYDKDDVDLINWTVLP